MLSIMHNHLHVISSCHVLTPDSKSKNLDIMNKRTFSCIIHLQPLFLLKESIYKNRLEISQIEDHLQRPIYPLSPVPYWPIKPSFVWPIKPSFVWPIKPCFVWPTKPNFVLTTKPSFAWPTKPSSVLAHQA